MTGPNEPTDLATITEGLLNDGRHLGSATWPQEVRDGYDDFRVAIRSILATDKQYRRDMADLRSRADLLPRPGYQRLEAEILGAAKSAVAERTMIAEQAIQRIKRSLEEKTLPRVDERREALAREEARTALQGAKPIEAMTRMSREAQAAVLSSWGVSALSAAGIPEPELEQRDLRALAIATAAQQGEPREQVAASALLRLPRLAAAVGASTSAFEMSLREPA
jgi:hypothetical protein